MNAPQDAWAGPLAKRLIDRFRSQVLNYVSIGTGQYDETIGTTPQNEVTYPAAGAVVRFVKSERSGVQQGNEVEVWIDHETVPWPINTIDQLFYMNRRWKITEIESYGSGGGGTVGPIYIATLDGKSIITLDGKALIVQGSNTEPLGFTVYASRVMARAE